MVQIRTDELIPQILRLTADKGYLQPGKGGYQKLGNSVRVHIRVIIGRLYLAQGAGDHQQPVRIFTTIQNVHESWRKIAALPTLGASPRITTLHNQNLSILPTPESVESGQRRRRRVGVGIIVVIVFVVIAATLVPNGALSLGLIVGSIIFAFTFPQKLQKQKAIAFGAIEASKQRFQFLQNSYAVECSDQSFATKVQELSQLRNEYNALPLE